MLEHLLPLRLALAQGFRRTLFRPDAALERGLHLPAGIPHQMHHDQRGEKQGDEQRDGNQMVGDIGRGAEHQPDASCRQRRQRHAAEQRLLGREPGFQWLVTHRSTNQLACGPAPRQVIMTDQRRQIGPPNGSTLAAFQGSKDMVRRDIAAFPSVCRGTVGRASSRGAKVRQS